MRAPESLLPGSAVEPQENDNHGQIVVAPIVVSARTILLRLDVTTVVVAIPDIQLKLHSTFSAVQWVIDDYSLTLASLLLTTGALNDLLIVSGIVALIGAVFSALFIRSKDFVASRPSTSPDGRWQ